MQSWRITSSQIVVEDEWIRLRADTCETPHGKTISPYYVLDYPEWVTIVPITSQQEMVLVRQYRHGLGETLLELPCGGFAQGEDAIAAATRELAEETGYTGNHFEEIATCAPNPANHANLSHVVLATGLEQTLAQNLDYGEDIEVVLMPLEQVTMALRSGQFVQAMHVAALFYGLEHLNTTSPLSPDR